MTTALKLRAPTYPKGDANRFCGPSVLSALTGMTSGEGARLLRSINGKASIKSVSRLTLVKALMACKIRIVKTNTFPTTGPNAVTLAAWLKRTAGTRGGRVFLIVAGNHYQAVSGLRYVCGIAGAVVPLDHPSVKRRARVSTVYEIDAPSGITVPAACRKPKASAHPDAGPRATAKRLATKFGLTIDPDGRGEYWVYGPDGVYPDEEDDPCCGEHFCVGWPEVLDKVNAYVADLQKKAA